MGMVIRRISLEELQAGSLRALGLSSELSLTAPEAIACGLRRAAGFLCPCSRATLRRAVLDTLRGFSEHASMREDIDEILEALIAHGDLHEFEKEEGGQTSGSTVYTAPLAFVRRSSGTVLLLGVAPDGVPPLTGDLEARVRHLKHIRLIEAAPDENVSLLLRAGVARNLAGRMVATSCSADAARVSPSG